MRIAERTKYIEPFHVMALLAQARDMEATGIDIVHMEIGEPDFATPQPIIDAGIQALRDGQTHYTPAIGLYALRVAISDYYAQRYKTRVDPKRIMITPGSSGALQLCCSVLVNAGDEVLLTDPGYPCNRHFVRLVDGIPISVPVGPDTDYQLDRALLEQHWSAKTVAAMIATPANPTGTLLEPSVLKDIVDFVARKDRYLLVDEIYHGLEYAEKAHTALALPNTENIFVINSFSKYFGMTGWRLGWLVAPDAFIPALDKLAQNIFLAASTPAQYAALAAFKPETLQILEERRQEFERRRDFLLPQLRQLGFEINVEPQGAFYIYANCSRFSDDSFAFCQTLLREAHVAVTPGLDFGQYRQNVHLRFAYTSPVERLSEGVSRLSKFLGHSCQ